MIQLRRILLPTDLSENARVAIPYACAFAEQFEAELHLLHVVDVTEATLPIYELALFPGKFGEQMEKQALKELETILDPGWAQGRRIVRATRQGRAFSEIVQYAKERSIDLIVIATHGRTGLSHLLVGSVAERVVRTAPCPVLSVHPTGQQFVAP